jgi:hypothetical protein
MQETYWSLTTEQLLAALHTANNGLQQTDAESRIKRYGPNALKAQRQATAFGLLLRQFRSPLVLILIMLVMSERGAEKLLASKFTLGAEGSVAARPVGRTATAQTDAHMHADILSWSRSQGLFAGVALEGATLREDLDDNATLMARNWRTARL